MALGSLEWVVIAVVAIVFLMMGPKKIPELAKSLGLARKEFAKGSTDATLTSVDPGEKTPIESADATLIDAARKLGIETEGKTKEQISQEIVRMAQTRV